MHRPRRLVVAVIYHDTRILIRDVRTVRRAIAPKSHDEIQSPAEVEAARVRMREVSGLDLLEALIRCKRAPDLF